MGIPLAWLQLRREPMRLLVALAGVTFAVVLVFMQLGFNDALFRSSVRWHEHLTADLVLISPRSPYLVAMRSFSRRRLYQAAGYEGVASVAPLYVGLTLWKNPYTGRTREIFLNGFDPTQRVFDIAEVNDRRSQIRLPDRVLFDRTSRPEYGPIARDFVAGQPVATEVADHHITVVGLFDLGTSFGVDGTVITSDLNFRRVFPGRKKGLINLGLITLRPGANAEAVQTALRQGLPKDVDVLTKQGYIQREIDYWERSTPIGYVFAFGSIMGLVVGAVIVYQILFADISMHLPEYATLKAMGYTNAYLFSVVFQESLILAVLGYLPGVATCVWLYRVTEQATHLPLFMTWERGTQVLALTILMCSAAGAIALRKLRSADPAEVF